MSNNLKQANREWASRPDDQRFTSLNALHAFCQSEKDKSVQGKISKRRLQFDALENDPVNGLVIGTGQGENLSMTNWAFSQACKQAGATAEYISKLPAILAKDCLNYGTQVLGEADELKFLAGRESQGGLPQTLKALTSEGYGRIYNADITKWMLDRGFDQKFHVPGEFGKQLQEVTKANTTLYASDRDMFVFLADENNRIEVPNRRDGKSGSLARGFFLWNSEVGSASIGIAFFLFDYVCQNRTVWGAQDYKEIRLRHTVSAPDRWLEEVTPVLHQYVNSSIAPVQAQILAAQQQKIDRVEDWLANRYGKNQAKAYQDTHLIEEGRPIETLWDVSTAITAKARVIPFQNERVILEREAGKVLALAA